MRIIAIADDDDLVGKRTGESAEILISLGDLYDTTIEQAQARYHASTVYAVKGNHDSPEPFPSFVTDLHLQITPHRGICIGGFSGCWQYKPRGHHLFTQPAVTEALTAFPPVDVFIAHNSPAGIHERDSYIHQGFHAFIDYIDRAQPRYFLHGHQHVNQISQRGQTTIIGVFGETLLDLTIDQA